MQHVSWKVRREAHLDLAAACRTIAGPADPRVHEFGPLFRYTVRDDNPDVQELALDSLLTFLAVVDPCDASRYAKDICDSLVARCLGGRPITIEKAKTIFLMFIELHAVDIFLDSMENAVRKKVQTVVIKSVELLQQALQQFGSDVVSAERIMKVLPELLESSDSPSEVLAIELSRWIGRKALRRSVIKKIAERRKGNLSELLLDAQQMTKRKPTRMLRSRQGSTIGGELFREKSVGNTFRNAANALYSDAGANNSACKGIVEKHEPTKTTDVRVTNKSRDATDKFVEDRTIETANTSVIDISSEIRNLKIYNPGTVVGNANISNNCALKLDMKDPVKTFFNMRNCIGHHRWWCYTNSDLCYEHGHKTRRSWLLPRSGMFFQYVEVRGKLMCFVGDACTSWLSSLITEKTVAEFPHESGKKYFVEGSWGKLSWKKLTCSGNYSPSLGTTTLGGESLEDACLIIYRHVNDGDAFDKEVLQACFTRVIVHLWDTLRNNEALRRVLCAFNPLFSSCVNELGRDLVPDLKNWKQICQNLEDSIINDIPFVQIHCTSPDSVLAALERIRILYQNNQVRVPYDFRNLPIKPDEWGRKGRRGAVRKDGTQSLGSKSSGGQAHDLGAPSRYPSFVLRDWKKLDSQDTVEDLFDMDIVSDDDMMDCLDGTMYQTDNAMLPKQMPYHPAPSRDLLNSGQSQRKENQDNLLMSKFVSAKEFPCLCTMEFRLFLLQLLMRSCLSTFTPRAHEEMLWQC